MVDLDFEIERGRFERRSLTPLMLFDMRVSNRTPQLQVRNVQLQCLVKIEAARRRYDDEERERLVDLFLEPERWSESLRSLVWAQANVSIAAFEEEARVSLPVPCSCDFSIAATKYFHALQGGFAPVSFLFSGAVFFETQDQPLQIAQIPWSKSAQYQLPAACWREMMEHHYQDGVWLRLGQGAFEALDAYKRGRRFADWEEAIRALLEGQREGQA